ncbi:MAG: MBL fold metallo-hydrolase [Candidatus Kaiserbacteria bacterium]|nr:MBL fold metallo-hydrolase [Candidatus Kaiserbacteria bacterium]
MAEITFCGGAGEVTGANFLFDAGSARFLVDCGSREEEHVCASSNLEAFPYDVSSIDALFVTHSHQDHIGRIPRLIRAGFAGPIYSTPATKDIARIMFDDAIGIMQSHAEQYGCEILYEKEDAERALDKWRTLEYHAPIELKGVNVELFDSGHILGSALVKFTQGERSIVFTGDIGNAPEPLLHDPEIPSGADYLVIESVYGDRVHEDRSQRRAYLKEAIEDARARKGTLLIPSFSIERTQVLLSEVNDLIREGLAPLPVYLDAPLATRLTEVFRAYKGAFNDETRARFEKGDDPFDFPGLTVIDSSKGSHGIDAAPDPKVIISGAGMSSGGRIRAHERASLSDKKTIVLLTGYQAPGSLGRRLLDGVKKVRIDEDWVRVHAEIRSLTGYSGHADREQLLSFVESIGASLKSAYVVMGEPRAALFLAQRIKDFLGIDAIVPQRGDTAHIDW